MKILDQPRIVAFGFAGALLVGSIGVAHAQLRADSEASSDSIVAVVADSKGLLAVSREQLPPFGTFWVIRNSIPCISAPLPYPPLDESLPVYAISNEHFLVDETQGPLELRRSRNISPISTDYTSVVLMQVNDLMGHVSAIQAEESRQLSALTTEGPPPIPGEGSGIAEVPITNSPPVYTLGLGLCVMPPLVGSNSIAIALTNTPGSGWLTNAYDLFYTTNMSPLAGPALCVTNWAWWARSNPGQTNFAISNPGFPECYYRLATLQDSDADGLTDAYELLTSHTDPENPDTDGDGLSDGFEISGILTNPRVTGVIPTLTGCPIPACPIP